MAKRPIQIAASTSAAEWLDRFDVFVRSKPADEQYPVCDPSACALAQFGYPHVGMAEVKAGEVPEEAYFAVFGRPTFGALAERLAARRAAKPGAGK